MAQSSLYRKILRIFLGTLMLSCITPSGAGGQDRDAGSPSRHGAVVRLPIVDRQDIRFARVAVNNVPIPASTLSVSQDQSGFVWFGTLDGLLRYDGYNLRTYKHDTGNPNSLAQTAIRSVYKGRNGILWIATGHAGLDKLEPAQDTITHYRHDPGNPESLSSNDVRCVFQESGGLLWIGTGAGLDRLDLTTGSFTHYRHDARDKRSLSSDGILTVFEDRRGNLWVGTTAGLNKLDRSTGRFSRFLHDPSDPRSLGYDNVGSIQEDQSGVLWVGSVHRGGLSAMDVKTGEFTRYSFHLEEPGGPGIAGVSTMYVDSDGVLWMGTRDGGLLRLDRNRRQVMRYGNQPANPYSLHNDAVKTIFEDAEGVMWIGTQDGISRFLRKPLPFVNHQLKPGNPHSLHDNTIRSVHGDSKGFLWIGTKLGFNQLDRRTGQVTLYLHDPSNVHSISDNRVSATREVRAGELWVATFGGGLNRFLPATRRFVSYRHDPKDPASLSDDEIWCLLAGRQGDLWVGTLEGGLNRFDSATGRFKAYRHDPNDPQSLTEDRIIAMFEDRAGMLWVGTTAGLNRFDPKTERFTRYLHDPKDSRSLSHNLVNAIREDREGRLWFGTPNGLNQLDRSRGTFTALTSKDGLPDDAIEAILEDREGYLWLATHNGLSRFHPPTKTFHNYSESDGLPASFLNPYGAESSWQSQDGELVFGSLNGVTTFYPERLSSSPYIPPVVLTDFQMFNKPVLPGADSPLHKPIWATDSLTLTHTQSIFTLEFAGLSYAAPEKNRYRYRLEGLESEWNEVDSRRRQATYTNLAARRYVFRVQASNKDGVWNEKGVSLTLTVLPPWWATWWFRSLMGLAIASAMLAAHRSRLKGLRLAGVRLEAQVAERTRELEIAKDAAERANKAKTTFLANMSHELRTPLNAILGFSALVRDKAGLPEEHRRSLDIVNRSGEHLLGLIDDVLDTAKIEAGHTKLENVSFDVTSLVRDNIDMMCARAADKGLELFLESSSRVPRFIRSDAGKLRQVLINLIGNAVKFTDHGSVTVCLDAQRIDDRSDILLILEVEDTGIGIVPEDQARIFEVFVQAGHSSSRKGTGLGLSITRQFVELMGGTVSLRSTPGKGSKFRVEVPVEPAEESEGAAANQDRGQVVGLEPGLPAYRILIVEDRKENWLLLQRLLEDAGFQVQVAEDGVEGVERFRSWQPHLIWMDIRLSVMGGIEATREIRSLKGGRQVKIVALTASAFAQQREEVLAAGLDDFLRKPFRREEIFDCMARHLGVRYTYRQIEPVRRADSTPAPRPDLAMLPEQLLRELADAVVTLDAKLIGEAIARVAKHDAQLGEGLARAAKRSAYTEILKVLEGLKGPVVG
jgi:signal transduction histidine kinase/ligand-binding sensor domain-containing protein/DNA-binding response OmpR family regulator